MLAVLHSLPKKDIHVLLGARIGARQRSSCHMPGHATTPPRALQTLQQLRLELPYRLSKNFWPMLSVLPGLTALQLSGCSSAQSVLTATMLSPLRHLARLEVSAWARIYLVSEGADPLLPALTELEASFGTLVMLDALLPGLRSLRISSFWEVALWNDRLQLPSLSELR